MIGYGLGGRWECGTCGATGEGWWNEEDDVVLEGPDDHECETDG